MICAASMLLDPSPCGAPGGTDARRANGHRGMRRRIPSRVHTDAKARLTFTGRLSCGPSVIDYVAGHELAHLIEPNYTPEFWVRVGFTVPEYEKRKE